VSVQKRGNAWGVTVYDPVLGRKRWVGTRETKADARRLEATAILEARTLGPGETCDSFAARWVKSYPRRKESTNEHYHERVAQFGKDFAGRKLASITRLEARRWVLANQRRHGAVRAMFTDAKRDGLVAENPFLGMGMVQPKGRKDLTVPTVAEVDALTERADALCGPYFAALIPVAAYTGMRPGEMYALDWQHVDLVNQEISVVAQISKGRRTLPKNNYTRKIAIPAPALKALEQMPFDDRTIVFRTLRAGRLTGRTVHYYWDRCRCAINRPDMTLYELRHFAAAHMLNTLGLPAHAIALQLGHTDGGVLVQKLYGHPDERVAREQIKRAFDSSITRLRQVPVATGEADDPAPHETPAQGVQGA
jgi:integrase